jgi:hypothetical protein
MTLVALRVKPSKGAFTLGFNIVQDLLCHILTGGEKWTFFLKGKDLKIRLTRKKARESD